MNKPIDPGEGYRLLEANRDRYEEGDESLVETTETWHQISVERVGWIYNLTIPVRRKIEVADRWIPLSERLPSEFPCQLVCEGKVFIGITRHGDVYRVQFGTLRVNEVTHWKPLRLSPPPEPEVSDDEKAFLEWMPRSNFMHWTEYKEPAHEAWLAALEYARAKK